LAQARGLFGQNADTVVCENIKTHYFNVVASLAQIQALAEIGLVSGGVLSI